MTMRRLGLAALLFALVGASRSPTGPAAISFESSARASVVRPQSFENLVDRAQIVVVARAVESTSLWEDSRIVTYTRVAVEETVAGSTKLPVLWVRTLGGEVGDLGQHVDGEATFEVGKSSLLFLEAAFAGTFAVSARAQGQFFFENRPAGRVLRPHPAMGAFLLRGPHDIVTPAADRLKTRFVDDAARDIRTRWEKTHAAR
jgi:hypothetical protein